MKYCNRCRVNVAGSRKKCPLCQSELAVFDENGKINKFPKINKKSNVIDWVWRIFLIVSILAIFVCFIINYEFPGSGFWYRFVVVGVITSWILLFVVMKKYKNILKCLFYETIVIGGFVVFWDYYTGMHGWSLDFALPILFMLTIITMGILSKVLKIGPEEHIVYLLCLGAFGVIPSVFLFNEMLNFTLPSLICIGMSFVLIFTVILFEGKKMLEEFSRRLHI